MLKTGNWTKVKRNHSYSMECLLEIIILKIKYLYCVFNNQLWYYSHRIEYRIKDTCFYLGRARANTENKLMYSWWPKKREELCRGRGAKGTQEGAKGKSHQLWRIDWSNFELREGEKCLFSIYSFQIKLGQNSREHHKWNLSDLKLGE